MYKAILKQTKKMHNIITYLRAILEQPLQPLQGCLCLIRRPTNRKNHLWRLNDYNSKYENSDHLRKKVFRRKRWCTYFYSNWSSGTWSPCWYNTSKLIGWEAGKKLIFWIKKYHSLQKKALLSKYSLKPLTDCIPGSSIFAKLLYRIVTSSELTE